MPRESSDLPRPSRETPNVLHAMATHARRLAAITLDEQAANQLTAFAGKLEARATSLEAARQIVSHEQAVTVKQSDPDLD
jgi:hypothetical protein